MSNYDSRLAALNIAREITPHGDTETLIANALLIESHLLGKPADPERVHFVPGLDFSGKLQPVSTPDVQEWSGTARDLVNLCNNGDTLICKSRQVGMTTFLCEYVANKTRLGETVLFFAANGGGVTNVKTILQANNADMSKITLLSLNRFGEHMRGKMVDHVIVDGLAFLPYGKEIEFVASVLPTSKHFIFASEPAQAQGLFHDLWKNSSSFQKMVLTWHTPLFQSTADRHKRLEQMKINFDDARFRNEFECEFRVAE